MLTFTYEGEKYQTKEYRYSECGAFWLVPAKIVSYSLALVMDELIIPIKDGNEDSPSPSPSRLRLQAFRERVFNNDPEALEAHYERSRQREIEREIEQEERNISFDQLQRERLEAFRERQRQSEERQRQSEERERQRRQEREQRRQERRQERERQRRLRNS